MPDLIDASRPRPDSAPIARVLLVDDGATDRLLAGALLERARFAVTTAENGRDAVEVVRGGGAFDVILMDLVMPVMDGFAAAAEIRALGRARGANTPIVAFSALAPGSAAPDGGPGALDGHIAKPYDPARFVDQVQGVLRGAAGRRGPAPLPVWNAARYEALVRRLGRPFVEPHLRRMAAQCGEALSALRADPDDAPSLARHAHRLVSPAGMLGFDELTAACLRVQAGTGTAECGASALALSDAIDRALAAVPSPGRAAGDTALGSRAEPPTDGG